MFFASVDCGTTNSRVYIINEKGEVKGKGKYQVGISDVAREKSNKILKEGLSKAFEEAFNNAKIDKNQLSCVISAGMITSELGLCEVPHISAPVGLDEMVQNLKKKIIEDIIAVDVPWYFIPGIKNYIDSNKNYIEQMGNLDFMRGEEVQALGIVHQRETQEPVTLVILSSHTKFIAINKEKQIEGSLTTLSGQIYRAFLESTSIGKSLLDDGTPMPDNYFDIEKIDKGFDLVRKTGLLRSMMIPRFLDVLVKSKWYERLLIIESAIASDDLLSLSQVNSMGFTFKGPIVLTGQKRRCELYKHLLKNKLNWNQEIELITNTKEIDELNIHGVYQIAKRAKLI